MCNEIFPSNNTLYHQYKHGHSNRFLCYFTLAEVMNMITSSIDDAQPIVMALSLIVMLFLCLPMVHSKGVSTFKALGI